MTAAATAKDSGSSSNSDELIIPAHRTILSFHSEVFAKLLLSDAAGGSGGGGEVKKAITIEQTDPVLFESMLSFMYTVCDHSC